MVDMEKIYMDLIIINLYYWQWRHGDFDPGKAQ